MSTQAWKGSACRGSAGKAWPRGVRFGVVALAWKGTACSDRVPQARIGCAGYDRVGHVAAGVDRHGSVRQSTARICRRGE